MLHQLKEICRAYYDNDPISQGVMINETLYNQIVKTYNFQQFTNGVRPYFKLKECQVYPDSTMPLFSYKEYSLWDPTPDVFDFDFSAHKKLEIMALLGDPACLTESTT